MRPGCTFCFLQVNLAAHFAFYRSWVSGWVGRWLGGRVVGRFGGLVVGWLGWLVGGWRGGSVLGGWLGGWGKGFLCHVQSVRIPDRRTGMRPGCTF